MERHVFGEAQGAVGWIEGYFNESLSQDRFPDAATVAATGMGAASFVDVDCDLYESTRDALAFFFRTGLARPGTLFGYDDFWVLPCGEGNGGLEGGPLAVGEGRAHREAAEHFGVVFRCVAGPCSLPRGRLPALPTERPQQCGDEWLRRSAWGVIFEVVSVGGKGNADHGFAMDEQDIAWFRANNDNCLSIRNDGVLYTLPANMGAPLTEGGGTRANEEGVVLSFLEPPHGATWRPSAFAVRLHVDLTADAPTAVMIREHPDRYQLCIRGGAALEEENDDGRHRKTEVLDSVDSGALPTSPRSSCYPLSRGHSDIAPLKVAAPRSADASAKIEAWLEELVEEKEEEEGEARVKRRRYGLTFVELDPPAPSALGGNVGPEGGEIDGLAEEEQLLELLQSATALLGVLGRARRAARVGPGGSSPCAGEHCAPPSSTATKAKWADFLARARLREASTTWLAQQLESNPIR